MTDHGQPLNTESAAKTETDEKTAAATACRAAKELYGLKQVNIVPAGNGRVNETWLADSESGRFILQKLNDFFGGDEALGLNWLNVYEKIQGNPKSPAPPMPPIFPDLNGKLLSNLPDMSGCWRLTGFIDGCPTPLTPKGAHEAARLLGHLHHLLNIPAPLPLLPLPEGEFTNQHLCRSEEFEIMLACYRKHPHLEELKPLIEQAAEKTWQLPFHPKFLDVFSHHDMVIHGDPKADNFLFSTSGQAIALLDWDSVCYGHELVDVAEMLRSWGVTPINGGLTLRTENMAAILAGYAETGLPLNCEDLAMLPAVLRAISLNLCRRYLTDALAEVYFKWNQSAYCSLYEQNRARATIMLNLAEMLLNQEIALIDAFSAAYSAAVQQD